MLMKMHFSLNSLLFCVITPGIYAFVSTHWMVTENGFIQPRMDSPFEMANPFDLLAFLNQDTRWENIINLFHDLSRRKDLIRRLWTELEEQTDVSAQLSRDQNCVKANPLSFLDWYASSLEDGRSRNIAEEEYKLHHPNYRQVNDVPDCKKISSLTFSMFAFEHLEAMAQRENLSCNPELALPEQVSPIMNIDQFGQWVAGALKQNSSSWLHYNMASLYWRVRGNAPKAVECSRRALYYAPRQYKDIALLSLGTAFHRSKMTEDAVIVLEAAVDHQPGFQINHFVLGNAYAVLGEFNNSVKHYDACMKADPSFDLAKKHRHGVLCHAALLDKMANFQSSLSTLRLELQEYSQREAHWLKSQAAFLKTMRHREEYDFRNVENNCEKMTQLTGLDIKQLKKEGDKNSLIQYFLDGPMYNDKWLSERGVRAVESAYNMQRLMKHVEKHAEMVIDLSNPDNVPPIDGDIKKEIGPTPQFPDSVKGKPLIDAKEYLKSDSSDTRNIKKKPNTITDNDHFEFEGGIVLYPPQLRINRNSEDFDKEPNWPSNKFCKDPTTKKASHLDAIYPVFLPFENKGIRLKTLLTDMIDAPLDREHDLPWHPPTCPQDKDAPSIQKKNQKNQMALDIIHTTYLTQKLFEYVGNGDIKSVQRMEDAEIGQRIYSAIQMEIAPKWLLYTLASLYWRVRGNNVNAMHCLLNARKSVPLRHKDIVMTSLASVYLEMGNFDDAMTAAEEAYRLSLYEHALELNCELYRVMSEIDHVWRVWQDAGRIAELVLTYLQINPATNFMIAQLNMVKRHRNTQLFHLKQVLRVEANFMGGLVRSVLNGWACLMHWDEDYDFNPDEICTQVQPGVSMVCDKDGTNCHMSTMQCSRKPDNDKRSTLVRLLQLIGNEIHESSGVGGMDVSIFDEFISRMPKQRTEVDEHKTNFYNMRLTLEKVLRGCGKKGCSSEYCLLNCLQPEDLSLTIEDCPLHRIHLEYWLHIISLKQILEDSNARIPPVIGTLKPSSKRIPECRMYTSPLEDFVSDVLYRVDVHGWEPLSDLMQQLTETFNHVDFLTLGGKLAKYIDTWPDDWVGSLAAGWWCAASGHGPCAVTCFMSVAAFAPEHTRASLLSLTALLHLQSKVADATEIAYLMLYLSPKSKMEAFLVAYAHTYMMEYEQAVWMYRYALTFDEKFLPAKACLHTTMCLMLFGEGFAAATSIKTN